MKPSETDRKKVSIAKIKDLLRQIEEFNQLKLDEIDLVDDNGNKVNTPEILEKWRFIGLSNESFVYTEFWTENHQKLAQIFLGL